MSVHLQVLSALTETVGGMVKGTAGAALIHALAQLFSGASLQ